jgi:hypothetical protein
VSNRAEQATGWCTREWLRNWVKAETSSLPSLLIGDSTIPYPRLWRGHDVGRANPFLGVGQDRQRRSILVSVLSAQ